MSEDEFGSEWEAFLRNRSSSRRIKVAAMAFFSSFSLLTYMLWEAEA